MTWLNLPSYVYLACVKPPRSPTSNPRILVFPSSTRNNRNRQSYSIVGTSSIARVLTPCTIRLFLLHIIYRPSTRSAVRLPTSVVLVDPSICHLPLADCLLSHLNSYLRHSLRKRLFQRLKAVIHINYLPPSFCHVQRQSNQMYELACYTEKNIVNHAFRLLPSTMLLQTRRFCGEAIKNLRIVPEVLHTI